MRGGVKDGDEEKDYTRYLYLYIIIAALLTYQLIPDGMEGW